jgi:hypothetical protein
VDLEESRAAAQLAVGNAHLGNSEIRLRPDHRNNNKQGHGVERDNGLHDFDAFPALPPAQCIFDFAHHPALVYHVV